MLTTKERETLLAMADSFEADGHHTVAETMRENAYRDLPPELHTAEGLIKFTEYDQKHNSTHAGIPQGDGSKAA